MAQDDDKMPPPRAGIHEDRLLDICELADLLGVVDGTAYHYVSQHKIPERCIVRLSSRCLRFRESAIWDWLDSLTAPDKTRPL